MVAKVSALLIVLLCGVVWGRGVREDTPTFSQVYKVKAVLQLPYAEIVEPLTVWYDGTNQRSRIDYYEGLVKNILRGDEGQYGASYKVAFMTNYQVTNKLSCFGGNGSSDAPVSPQSIFPDTTNMTLQGTELMNGVQCKVWQLVVTTGQKTSTYTLWVDASSGAPVRYEMMGFDSLIGSHYDKYLIDYSDYQGGATIDPSIFSVANMTCTDFPGPGKFRHLQSNPMLEFVAGSDSHIPHMFGDFKAHHNKKYQHDIEHELRQNHFRQNVRFIHSKNRQGLTYNMAINHLADRSAQELKMMNGFHRTMNYHEGVQGLPFNMEEFANTRIPDEWNWRLYGAVTPVKDQAVCGSCWSFGTTGTIEGAYFVKTGKLVSLSQQELMDCSWGEGNNGCDGGEDFRAYNWIMKKGGLTTEDQYGQYLAVDGRCHSGSVEPVVKLSGYVNVTAYDQDALRAAIFQKGPVSVAIDASHKSLSFYANGVYYEPECGNKPDDLDHAVLAVGYGKLNGQGYWLIKNSWSTYWGNDGYVLMAQKDNNCGVATSPTYPIIA